MRPRSVRKARKQEPVLLDIGKLSHEGRGIAHHEGKVVFVDQALPGEQVRAQFTDIKGSWAQAATLEVHVAAATRVEPVCPHFQHCGGCSLQHMASAAQLDFKEAMVHEQLVHSIGHDDYERLAVIDSPSSGYRRKARLGVRFVAAKERVLVGFRERYSNFIADIDSCEILDPLIGRRLPDLAGLIGGMDAYRQIPQVEVAVGDGHAGRHDAALVFRHLSPLSPGDLQALEAFGREYALDIYLQPKGPDTVHLLYPADAEPRLYYGLPESDLEFAFHPLDFTQVNAPVNRRMVARAIELLDLQSTDRVLDLFCGLGNFTLPIARRAGHVTGVEGVRMMVERGYENARANAIDNVEFHCADLALPPEQHAWLQNGFDKVMLDPPRSGALEVLPALIAARPSRIVYVSCNPATLARDAGVLKEAGYHLQAAGAMDMFPHTGHVEAMALFTPA